MEVDNKNEQQNKQELKDGRCSELDESDIKIGDWCSGFESKAQIADSNDETFEASYRALEVENLKIKHELELLKKENTGLKERISNLENERNESHEKKNTNEQILVDLMDPNEDEELVMVNSVLQIEKENAEKDAATWKQKYEKLLLKMDNKGRHEHECVRLMVDLNSFSGPHCNQTPNLPNTVTPPPNESKQKYKDEAVDQSLETSVRRAKKQLLFEDNKKEIAPQTPSVSKRVGIIDISDSEDDLDMLAAIGKDPVLCMNAVCAIYRRQTADEKVSKEAIHANRRGFSKFDASKGCKLGEFLTCGDPEGDLKVSVEQLLQYDAKGVDLCRELAFRYSNQLFLIFQGGHDRFFRCNEAQDKV